MHGRSPVRPTGCPGTQAKIKSTILVEIFHPLCTPLSPKRGTPTGPASHHSATPVVQYVVASRRRRRETSPRGSTHVCEGRGGRGVSPNSASQRLRRQQRCGSPATLPADACTAAPLPLPGFPVVEPRRAPDGRGNRAASTLSLFWSKRKGKASSNHQYIYLVFQSI